MATRPGTPWTLLRRLAATSNALRRDVALRRWRRLLSHRALRACLLLRTVLQEEDIDIPIGLLEGF